MGVRPFNVTNLGNVGLLDPEQVGYRDSVDIIKDESFKIQKSFVKIGWYLKHIRDGKLYTEDGYANIYECASDLFGYSQSTVSRFINICEKFSKDNNSPELDTRYAGFDKSQMIEMLPLNPDQLEKVTPDMTVTEIRAIKSEREPKKSKLQSEEENIPGQTSIEEVFPEYIPSSDSSGTHEQLVNTPDDGYTMLHIDPGATDYVDGDLVDERDVKDADAFTGQLELPKLTNNDQRKEWLANYKAWGLWYTDSNIDVNYYKYDFPDGSRLIVSEYPQRDMYWEEVREDEIYYHLLEKNKKGYSYTYDEKYRHKEDSETYLIEFLKNLQRKV